jgi:CheY-like chemotaxis protein
VDDEPDAAASLALFLGLTGHEVRTAADGREAIQTAHEFRPEAVVLDIGLPDLDGCEVARRLRSDRELNGAVLVALTGYVGARHRRLCLAAGFDSYLAKPADPLEVQKFLAGKAEGSAQS